MDYFATVGDPEKFPFLLYFFPTIATGYLYWQNPTRFYLFLLVLVGVVVIFMQSYHQAFKSISTLADNVKLLSFLKINPGNQALLAFAKNNLAFLFFDLAWYSSFFLVGLILFLNRMDKGAVLLLTGHIGLFIFVHIQLFFLSKLYNAKQKTAAITTTTASSVKKMGADEIFKIVEVAVKELENKNKRERKKP